MTKYSVIVETKPSRSSFTTKTGILFSKTPTWKISLAFFTDEGTSPICLSAKFLKYHLDYTLLFVRNRGYARHYSYLKSKIIGIPSVLEQKRIVAKIDLLFQKVSQLSE